MAGSLPQDVILFQIITRVPTKSVIRFKSVSKQWRSFLMSGIKKNSVPLPYADIILWNPLTTERKMLSEPSSPDDIECFSIYGQGYGLYYSSSEDDYKLLVVSFYHNVYIYSLKSDSWRKLKKKAPFQETNCWRPGFCVSENIYFMCYKAQRSIRFDTKAERFHKIQTPPGYDNNNNSYTTAITVHKGSIHLCVKYDIIGRDWFVKSTCIKLWRFNADGDIWSKLVTYQLGPNDDIRFLSPLHLMSNGKWLMRDDRNGSDGGRICQVALWFDS